jgi:MFS family permease
VARDRWNIVCHLLDGVFFFAALITISREMVIPTLISDLSDSALLVGLVTLIIQLGSLLPQVFYAKRVEGLAYKKRAVVVTAILQRVGWVPFLISLFLWWDARITLPLLFAMLACNSIGSGLIVPVWTDWYAKTVPEHFWARLLGLRRVVPAFVGLGLGELIGSIMENFEPPERYRILVSLAILFYALSLLCVALVKEEPTEGLPHHRDASMATYLRGLWRIVFGRPDFRLFMLGCLMATLPTVVLVSYLTKYGGTDPAFSEAVTGKWTQLYFAVLGLGSMVGGIMSDRRGVMTPFRLFPLGTAAAAAVAACSSGPGALAVAWGFAGFALGVQMVVMMPAVFRFSGPHRRPSYMAVRFVVLGSAAASIPPLAGLAIDAGILTYKSLFVGCTILALAGWAVFVGMADPRPEPDPLSVPAPDGDMPAAPPDD